MCFSSYNVHLLSHLSSSCFGYWKAKVSFLQVENSEQSKKDNSLWVKKRWVSLSRELVQQSYCHLGHGDGEPRDEPHHLLRVWSWNCSALPCHNLPERISSYSSCWQRAANSNCGKNPWQGMCLLHDSRSTFSPSLLHPPPAINWISRPIYLFQKGSCLLNRSHAAVVSEMLKHLGIKL